MLTELRIDNFAIIHHLDLNLGAGLITFTGETGAGKSIILDAIVTLLGGRVDIANIRSGSERSSIEATFSIPEKTRAAIEEILEREELMDDPAYLTLAREIRREGRSTARVNGRSVSAGLLRELSAYLIDIHGQSDHLSLLNIRQHLGLLDRYANTLPLLEEYTAVYRQLQDVRRELTNLRQAEQDAARQIDLLNYQVQEIEAAHLLPDEEETLRQDRTRLSNAENLASLSQEALQLLDDGTPEAPGISDLLGQVSRALSGLSRIDPSKAVLSDRVEVVLETLVDLSRELHDYVDEIEFNPKRLEQIEIRLDMIFTLKRKYGGSIDAILKFAASARAQLDTITHAAERIEILESKEVALLQTLAAQGVRLSEQRRTAAVTLAAAVETELNDLRMEGARFSVDIQLRDDPGGVSLSDGRRVAFDGTGIDRVEFLVAPNLGEGLNPLVKVASGGETSRLMLALKNVLARADYVPTLIFDEVDQGIGGRVGTIVGKKLWQLSRQHQVLCVTHLPQLAAFGEQHYRVSKLVSDGRTLTQVDLLSQDQRAEELAMMMGSVSDATLRSAAEALSTARQEIR